MSWSQGCTLCNSTGLAQHQGLARGVHYRWAMNNKKFTPMALHKGHVIRMIREQPELASELTEHESADDAIAELEAHPGEWIIDGELLAPDDERLPENLR